MVRKLTVAHMDELIRKADYKSNFIEAELTLPVGLIKEICRLAKLAIEKGLEDAT